MLLLTCRAVHSLLTHQHSPAPLTLSLVLLQHLPRQALVAEAAAPDSLLMIADIVIHDDGRSDTCTAPADSAGRSNITFGGASSPVSVQAATKQQLTVLLQQAAPAICSAVHLCATVCPWLSLPVSRRGLDCETQNDQLQSASQCVPSIALVASPASVRPSGSGRTARQSLWKFDFKLTDRQAGSRRESEERF